MENPVLPYSCVTPAGTSVEVQNEHTHNHIRRVADVKAIFLSMVANPACGQLNTTESIGNEITAKVAGHRNGKLNRDGAKSVIFGA